PLINVVPKGSHPYDLGTDDTEAEAGRFKVGVDNCAALDEVTLNVPHFDFQRRWSLRHLTRTRHSPVALPGCCVQGNCMNPDVARTRGPVHSSVASWRSTSPQRVPLRTNAPIEASVTSGTVSGTSTSSRRTGSSF